MSDRVGIKAKDNVNKKFSSLNLNQTYKGTKVEPKTTTGVPRHGLQSLGKVAASRRMPPPANLPSLKSENLGNDPTVALVPSGGGGWGSGKEKDASAATTTTTTTAVSTQSTVSGTSTGSQQPAQQQLKPTENSQKPTITTGQQTNTGQKTTNQTSGTSTKTWASSSSVAGGQERTSYPHQSQYFNREFPTLGGGNSEDRQPEERASHPPYGQPPRNMHDPPWMDKGGSGPPPRPSFGIYNGAPCQGPAQRIGYDSQAFHRDSHAVNNYSRPEGSGTFPYMGQSRPPNYAGHPAQRMNSGPRYAASTGRNVIKLEDSPSGYARPSILKEDDIRAMDAEDVDDGGWAGAQEEIDYSVKLNFDDDEPPSPVNEKNERNKDTEQKNSLSQKDDQKTQDEDSRLQEITKPRTPPAPRPAWFEPSVGESHGHPQRQETGAQDSYHPHRTWGGGHQQRNVFPTPSGPPAGGVHQRDGRRADYRGPEGFDKFRVNERSTSIQQARQRKEQEELELKRHREAAAQEKLRQLDAGKSRQLHIQTQDNSAKEQAGPRSPLSPAGSDQPVRRIMRRKDSGSTGDDDGSSVKSVESVGSKDQKQHVRDKEDRAKDSRERQRKTSSSDVPDGTGSRPTAIKEERRSSDSVKQTKEKPEEKFSALKETRKPDVEKEVQPRDSKPVHQRRDEGAQQSQKAGGDSGNRTGRAEKKEKESAQKDKRDKDKVEDQESKREGAERKSNENLRRREEPYRKKEHSEPKTESQERQRDESGGRKESVVRKSDRPGSKSERGSDESLRSRDGWDRNNDRRRGEDTIKRKRDDFERNEAYDQRGNRDRGYGRERSYSGGRGRPPLGGKSSLRGHPKSYSHGRTDRTVTQRRTSQKTRKDCDDIGGDDVDESVPAEEKSKVDEKVEERRLPDGDRRQTESDRRRKDQRHDSRSFGGEKRYERQSKEDRPYKGGSGRLPSRAAANQRSTDRATKFSDKTKNRGGFGVPPPKPVDDSKEAAPKSMDKEKEKPSDRPCTSVEGKAAVTSSADTTKTEEKVTKASNEIRHADRGANIKEGQSKDAKTFSDNLPVSNAWTKPEEAKETVKEVKTDHDKIRSKEPEANTGSNKDDSKTASVDSPKDTGRDRKLSGRVGVDNRQTSMKYDNGGQRERVESRDKGKSFFVKESRSNDQDTKSGEKRDRRDQGTERREQGWCRRDPGGDRKDISRDRKELGEDRRGRDSREQNAKTNRDAPRSDNRDSKNEGKSRGDSYRDGRRKQEQKFDERRDRTAPRGDLRREQDSKTSERRSRHEQRADSHREQTSKADGQHNRMESEKLRRDPESKPEERRDKTVSRPESKQNDSKVDGNRERTKPLEQTEPRDRVVSREDSRNGLEGRREDSDGWLEADDSQRKWGPKTGERSGNKGEQQSGAMYESSKRFAIGSTGSERLGIGRGRYRDSRRGSFASRRGGRGVRGSRGRGRGRPYGSGRVSRRASTASKDDDDDSDDSEKYHSANSAVDYDSDESESEVFSKKKDDHKDERNKGPTFPTGNSRGREHVVGSRNRGRGRGRGTSSVPSRNQRVHLERPPRFQKQDQSKGAGRGRGRGKGNRGQHTGYSTKENWDDSGKASEKANKNYDEGPSPKKRSPGNLQGSGDGKESAGGTVKDRKSVRSGQGNKSSSNNSFLAKKQQEVIKGSRKGGSRSSADLKSTFPAASTARGRKERRGKNDSAQDLDDIAEPPKKNPRRMEPQKMGIENIDLNNIVGVIDIDDIPHPTNETEPASPLSGFVEVKSKRAQKELRERAREEEERKKRETEDAALKSKILKSNNSNKSSKPPRFARNNIVPNQVSSVTRITPPPAPVLAASSPDSSILCGISSGSGEPKPASPLVVEKPGSPAPPPIFNAWTKPLSITPAKPPNASVDVSTSVRPDPLAVGSGKPTRPSGAQPKSDEPELKIQVTLPDTFQAMPTEGNMESQNTSSSVLIQEDDIKKREAESDVSLSQKSDGKNDIQMADRSVNTEKSTVANEKRQSNKFTKPPRFEKGPPTKRNVVDGRKFKGDGKEQSSATDGKPQPLADDVAKAQKEKSENRSRTARPRDPSKNQNHKPKPQVKVAKSLDVDESVHQTDKESQDKMKNNEELHNLRKRDSGELDVHSMSESLLDEAPLDVRIVETTEPAAGTQSMDKIKTEDDIKIDYEMKEKMVAAKKAWDDSVSSSASVVVNSPSWKTSSVSENDSTESNETSVVDQIPRPSGEVEESPESLTSSPSARLKKPAVVEQQNVCKVKPQQQQQQQQPVKPQVSSDDQEEYASSSAISRSLVDRQAQTSYPIQQTAVFTSKAAPQFTYSFDTQTLLPFNQYVQAANITTVQHTSPVRPQPLRPTSQSPPLRNAAFPQGQPVSAPSPLSQQPVLQESYRPLMQGTLYSTTSYPNNQYFPIPVVRPTAPPPTFQAPVNDEVSNSMYAIQQSKSQTTGHSYEQAVATGQQVFLPVEQQYLDQSQPQRQHAMGFYPDSANQTSLSGNISHVQPAVAFTQTDKRVQQHGRDGRTGHNDQQPYATSGQSEMVKHVNAKPFEPPSISSAAVNVTRHMVLPSRHVTAAPGPTSVSPAYQLNTAVVSMQSAVQGSSSSNAHAVTSSVVTQAHSIPVSRLSFHQFPGAAGSYQRPVQVPMQSITQPAYPTGLTYRTPVANYPPSSVGSQTGIIVQKSFPMVKQLVTSGRGTPIGHRMPEPIQRPNKPSMLSNIPKEKLVNQPSRPKVAHPPFSRRSITPIRGSAPQMLPYQLQQPPIAQQQSFRNQQHQLMLSGVQQFFAEESQQHRRQTQDHQKRELPSTPASGSGSQLPNQDKRKQQPKSQQEARPEQKLQKSMKKDEPKKPEYKQRSNRQQDRKEVRTAQIQPQRNQLRSQNRPKPSVPKQEPANTIVRLSAVEPAKTEQKSESKPDVVPTPLVS